MVLLRAIILRGVGKVASVWYQSGNSSLLSIAKKEKE
jgi:hypothetical protein